jgi:putative photosynthetic complex assembly protein
MSAPQTRFRRPDHNDLIPPVLTRAMVALALASLAIVAFARLTDRPLVGVPEPAAVVQERRVQLLADRTVPGMRVLDADTGAVLFQADNGGFLTAVHTGLRHNRGRHGLSPDLPIRLVAYANGRLTAHDDLTGWSVELGAFGDANRAAFERLLSR